MSSRKIKQLLMYPIYKIYEKKLWNEIRNGPMPVHVGIIPDGNRRWARQNRLSIEDGYYYGYIKLKEVLIWLLELGIKNVTIFALSTENCKKRSKFELEALVKYIKRGLEELLKSDLIHNYKVKVRFIGKFDELPEDLLELMRKLSKITEEYNNRRLTFAICYGGRQEILDAVKKLIEDYEKGYINSEEISEDNFRKYFYDKELEDLDLVIRTSGEIRISNFLLWHLAYSELFFCEAYWPEFRKIDLWRAIRSYQKRKRNFGA
jgi:tritrans,polycis-undecaprenyl-diphosphate synthase [geranylgeranyl-diphosphate specific]